MEKQKNRDNKSILLKRGVEYFEKGEYSKSVYHFKEILLVDPFYKDALDWAVRAMNLVTDLEIEIIGTAKEKKPVEESSQPPETIKVDTVDTGKQEDSSPFSGPDSQDDELVDLKEEDIVPAEKSSSDTGIDTEETIPDEEDPPTKIEPENNMMVANEQAGEKNIQETPTNLEQHADQDSLDQEFDEGFKAYSEGDYSNAYNIFKSLVEKNPDHRECQRYLKITKDSLKKKYVEKLGSLDKKPVLTDMATDKFETMGFSSKEGFLLSRIDGQTSFKHLMYISKISSFEAYRFFAKLLEQGLIKIS